MTDRPSGFYWVLFNWPVLVPDRAADWQPAYWDAIAGTWAFIGSIDEAPDGADLVAEVGHAIERPKAN